MLFLNTLEWQKDLKSDPFKLEKSISLKKELKDIDFGLSQSGELAKARAILFDFYMEEESFAFAASSISRVFDYRQSLESNQPELGRSPLGKSYFELLFTIDKLWQYTQAPVSELVKAGKNSLITVNGAANYANFKINTEEKPDLFHDTMLLVNNYLDLEIYTSLIDLSIQSYRPIDGQVLDLAVAALREFAGRSARFGFWNPDEKAPIPMLEDINIDSFALPH